jgi:hypothetical protein
MRIGSPHDQRHHSLSTEANPSHEETIAERRERLARKRAALDAIDAQIAVESTGPYATSIRARLAAWGGR